MPIIAMTFCHKYCQRWSSYQMATKSSKKMELVHPHQKLHFLTWRSIAFNFWSQIFGDLIALTSILVIMLSGVPWKPKSGSIIDFRSQLLKIWKNGSLKNGTPYRKMLFPEQSTGLKSVFTWSLRRMVVIYRNIFRRTNNIFIRCNYWFIIVREKSWIFYDTYFFFNYPLCIKRWILLETFLVHHRYCLEMKLSHGRLHMCNV